MLYGIISIRKPNGEEKFTDWHNSLTEEEKKSFIEGIGSYISLHKHPLSIPKIEILEFIETSESPITDSEHDEVFQHYFQKALKKYPHSILAEYCASDFKNPVLFIYHIL